MTLVLDRDLAIIEPSLFIDVTDTSTLLATQMDGDITDDELESSLADFEAVDITTGHVVVFSGSVLEVIDRVSDSILTVSRLRVSDADDIIPPTPGSNKKYDIRTFDRTIAEATAWLLGAAGLQPEDVTGQDPAIGIVNLVDVQRVIALRAIAWAFAAEAAIHPDDEALASRAVFYAQRAGASQFATPIEIDLTGDGVTDVTRWFSSIALVRQ